MDYGIAGRVALVGGASQGIGLACASALAREGVRVAICARDAERATAAAESLRARSGGQVVAVVGDLSHEADVDRVLDETLARLGEIEILVTNTGGPRPGLFEDLNDEDWDQAYELLVKSAIRLIRGVLPAMRERRWGRVIGVTSVSVKEPIEQLILSNVFRSGVTALFKTLAREQARHGITFNTVLPGLTDTERLAELYEAQAEREGIALEDLMARVARALPLGRLNRPDELGELVAFLASEAASGITGDALAVDGGQLRGLL